MSWSNLQDKPIFMNALTYQESFPGALTRAIHKKTYKIAADGIEINRDRKRLA
jgi:hypothetical protein